MEVLLRAHISAIILDVFLVTKNRIYNGPLGRLLRLFTRNAHFPPEHSTLLCSLHMLTPFTSSPTHFPHSPLGQ